MNAPRTDNIARGNHVVPTEWAEELERELTAVTEQRDKFKSIAETAINDHEMSEIRNYKLTEQRDRLAEALRMITTFDYSDLQCDNGHGARSVAVEALQSLTPNEL
jgi:hypothetical protein